VHVSPTNPQGTLGLHRVSVSSFFCARLAGDIIVFKEKQ
jgi:hypothetical protein